MEAGEAAVAVAVQLGELVVEAHHDLRTMPRWGRAAHLARLEGKLAVGVALYDAWAEAYGVDR